MQLIYRILDKLSTLFSNKKSVSKKRETIGSVSFIINKDDSIDIECLMPLITNANIDSVPSIAEKYANALNSITMGDLNDSLYENIKELASSSESNQQILLVNNIISFWSILYKEKQKQYSNKYINKYHPLIRPSQVFKLG